MNSLWFGTTALTLGGTSPVTITIGAVASNIAAATISAPLVFPSEAVFTTVGALGSANVFTVSGNITANTLTKTGHGQLTLSGTGNVLSGDAITVNAGVLNITNLTNLGLTNTAATRMTFNMHTFSSFNGGLVVTGTVTETYNG